MTKAKTEKEPYITFHRETVHSIMYALAEAEATAIGCEEEDDIELFGSLKEYLRDILNE